MNITYLKDLLKVATKNPNALIPVYDPTTGHELNSILVADLVGGEAVKFPWLISTTYMIDDLAEWNSKIWKSKVDNNTANQPAENAFWTEVSASTNNGTALQPWAAGVFSIVNSSVTVANAGYLLSDTVTLPFNSTDFNAELIAGKWLPLGGGGGGGGATTAAELSVTPPTGYTSTDMQGLSNEFALRIWREDLTAWVGNETTLTLTSNVFRDFGTVGVSTAVTVTLTAVTSPQLAEYMFKFKHGSGGSFSFTGVTIKTPPIWVVGHIYEAHIVRGVLIYNDLSI